jgi:DNA polymerase-3 subunit alpha (Gram-positive type)
MTDSKQSSLELLNNLSFCVFDLETTGGNHKSDKIIEIGLVKVVNLKIVEKKNYLIQPEIKIPDFIQKLTSITPKDVKDAPIIEDVIDEILEFMGDSVLVAHNTSFDVPFFNSVLRRLNKPELENKSICTHLMTKYLIPNLMNTNLNYMSRIFNITHQKAHRALDDALATAELLLKYLDIFITKGITKINQLYYPRNRYELDRSNFKKGSDIKEIESKLRSLKTPYLFTVKGENGVILFALPCANTEKDKEIEYILSKIIDSNWEMVTIKLVGPFIEGAINFNTMFGKLSSSIKSEVVNFLWATHLPNKRMPNLASTDEELSPLIDKNFGDFLITNHLVPEQYIIYPISSMHQKSELVFRYPGHKKKLIQYVSSKSSKMKANKLKKTHFPPQLKSFIDHYLIMKKETVSDLYIFDKGMINKSQEEFISELDAFLAKNPNPYHYPADYI